jgi:DNA-binding MltR family transcriptional regulator
LFSELKHESDRGCILVGTSAVDDALKIALKRRLSIDEHIKVKAVEPMFESMGPLSTLSARIKLAYAIGLIPRWIFEDLEKIRKIRNRAAHQHIAHSFDTPYVASLSEDLQGAGYALARLETLGERNQALPEKSSLEAIKTRVSEVPPFIRAVCYIAGYLDSLAERV